MCQMNQSQMIFWEQSETRTLVPSVEIRWHGNKQDNLTFVSNARIYDIDASEFIISQWLETIFHCNRGIAVKCVEFTCVSPVWSFGAIEEWQREKRKCRSIEMTPGTFTFTFTRKCRHDHRAPGTCHSETHDPPPFRTAIVRRHR